MLLSDASDRDEELAMRSDTKLTLALSVVLMIQFALYSYLGMRRLTGFFEHDVKGDALLIGQTLATAVVGLPRKPRGRKKLSLW